MKRIVFVSHYDLNLYLFRLPIMQELKKNNWNVYALIPYGKYNDLIKKESINVVNYNIIRKSINPIIELRTIYGLYKEIKRIDPDIVHTFMHKSNIYGSFAAQRAGVPVIITTVTGLGSFFLEKSLKSKIVKNFILSLYKVTSRYSDTIIFQNPDDLRYFTNNNIVRKDKSVLIKSSGIDTEIWKSDKKFHKNNKIKVITIGRLIIHKGIEEFIKVAQIIKKVHPNVEFLIVGDFYDGNPHPISKRLLESAIEKGTVTHIRWVEHAEVRTLLNSSDIFVLLSYREGIPRTGLEALAMGLPIVTTNVPGCKEIVIDGLNGFLVPARDVEAAKEAIIKLIENRELRESMGEESRKLAVKEFDIRKIVDQYLKLYEELIKLKI